MSKVLTVEQREQAGSDSYNRFEYQVHWIVCHITGNQQGQDADNLQSIFESLELFLSNEGQVIVGTERETGIEKKASSSDGTKNSY